MSDFCRASDMSCFCKVLRLFSSATHQALMVSSVMKISHALANRIGASPLIILTSSSVFITFLIRASGSEWDLKSSLNCEPGSLVDSISLINSCQYWIIISRYRPVRPWPTLWNTSTSSSFSSMSGSCSPIVCWLMDAGCMLT